MRQTFSLVCDSELPVSNFCEMYCSSASFCAMMTCKDLSLLSKREILACVGVCVVGGEDLSMHKHVTMMTMVSESRRLVIQCYKVLLVSTTEYSVCIPQGFCSDWLFSHTQQSTVEASTATHIASHHMT